jgi:hypothetical protein
MSANLQCSNCANTPADPRIVCEQCAGYPLYDNNDRLISYCTEECRNHDRENHLGACQSNQTRRALCRASKLMQQDWLTLRENCFNLDFRTSSSNEHMNTSGLTVIPRNELSPFPKTHALDEGIKLALLTAETCCDAKDNSYHLAKALLGSKCSFISKCDVAQYDTHPSSLILHSQ